jgi:tetratricopeptide (TPR) repeat protein
VADRLLVDLRGDGQARVMWAADGGQEKQVSRSALAWPLDDGALEDLRWYLEDYLVAPFGVWEERGPLVAGRLRDWGELVFASVFGAGPARDACQQARDQGSELVFRSADPGLLALPWELMRDGHGAVALGAGGISRSLSAADAAGTLAVPGGKLRVLMVISRPGGAGDVRYQMVARPLLERLAAVRGDVELTVLRPATFKALRETVTQAAAAGVPFHMVHFDGHGVMPERSVGRAAGGGAPSGSPREGMLAFELPGGGAALVAASRIAAVLAGGKVPVAVLNACQSGAMGKELEASVAAALLRAGCASVVAMAYSVYAVAAAEFMAAFYESLFAGFSVGQAVTAGRRRLFERADRPSPKGDLPLADWMVPVHYLRAEVRFPGARTVRLAGAPLLDEALDQIRAAPPRTADQDPLAAVDGVFVSRDDLFYELEAAAQTQRVVVLAGPGGTGKTELAKGFARWWQDTGGVDDPRLVYWHSFEPGVATFGLSGVITGIGLAVFGTGFARHGPAEQLTLIKRLLAQSRALLVWDNFESVAEMSDPSGGTPPLDEAGRGQLREFLDWVRDHSPSTVIITSRTREAWLGQVRRIAVGGLSQAEAAEYAGLLLAPFPAAQRRRQQKASGELLAWLDGHPLSMRLILPRLQDTEPAELLAALRGTAPLPAAGEEGQGRLASLGVCISYSLTHLSEQTRRLLLALSLFHGTADENVLVLFSARPGVPDRFAGVSGPDWAAVKQEWAAVMRDSARVGLLSDAGAGAYRIHPALPGYLAVAWHAEAPGRYADESQAAEQALRAACAVYGQWLVKQIDTANAPWAHVVIGLLRRTFGAMLGHALDHQAWGEAESIVRALDKYWSTRGLTEEASAWADRIVRATVGPGQPPTASTRSLWVYTVGRQAKRDREAGQLDRAAQSYRELLAWLHDQPQVEWISGCIAVNQTQFGITLRMQGRFDEADDCFRKSIAIDEDAGNRLGLAITYGQLGVAAQERGRLDEADKWYGKALQIDEELGLPYRLAEDYHQLGNTALLRGQADKAEERYLRSLAISRAVGDRLAMSLTYHQLGNTAQERGRLDEADEWYRQALQIRQELGLHSLMASDYLQLGTSAYLRGRLDEAEDWYKQSLASSASHGDRHGTAAASHQLALVLLDRAQLDQAEDWNRRSLATRQETGDRAGIALSYHQLGRCAQAQKRFAEAEDWYRRSLAVSEEIGNQISFAATCAQLGLLAEARAQPEQALEWNIRCVTRFEDFPSPLARIGPANLARLTRQLGLPTTERIWQQATGKPLPPIVRDWITRQNP